MHEATKTAGQHDDRDCQTPLAVQATDEREAARQLVVSTMGAMTAYSLDDVVACVLAARAQLARAPAAASFVRLTCAEASQFEQDNSPCYVCGRKLVAPAPAALTEKAIYDMACDYDECKTYDDIIGFARAIERALGISHMEKNA